MVAHTPLMPNIISFRPSFRVTIDLKFARESYSTALLCLLLSAII